jgi:lysine 6-dehydrogenase
MKTDFAVLGANGMQGKIVTRDLLESGYSVSLIAIETKGIESLIKHPKAEYIFINLYDKELTRYVLKNVSASIIINCVIADFNEELTHLFLEFGKSFLDLGSYEEVTYKQCDFGPQFQAKDSIGITGVGSTPGINNVMLRYARPEFDTIHTVHLGFAWDSNMPVFVAPFSIDVIAWEFKNTARIFENGKFIERYPNECTIDYDYRWIGRQKTHYTRHAEYSTFYEYLKDIGIQNIAVCSSFPEHSRKVIEKLIALGLTEYNDDDRPNFAIPYKGGYIEPVDFTEAVIRKIEIPEGYIERENIWIKIFGEKDGVAKKVEMDMLVETLPGWEDATCNVDTGMPASIIAQMIYNGIISERGVFSPEFIVPPEPFFQELAKRNIQIYKDNVKIN